MLSRAALAMIVVLACPALVAAESISPQSIRVIDGDTIGFTNGRPNARIVGFNAPETRNAACDDERRLGQRATSRLKAIVAADSLDLKFVRCACRPGTEGTRSCNYGRSCAVLRSRGTDVGDILIGEGLAVPFQCSDTGCPPTPKPWCG